MSLTMLGSLAGGIGLFMLGMRLMTDGLKLAAGHALRNILEKSTETRLRGLLSGAFITSLVQSSSAVTVATIGFVNAGLMNLKQAITVIYGSNIGTTITGWLVALIGLQVNIKAFALPAIGIGMFLHLIKGKQRLGALGEVLAGFGIFFLGIEILKITFHGLGEGIPLASFNLGGFSGTVFYLSIGFLLTLFMQSSSASIAIVLTATAGGAITLNNAAAVVIGANIGTTSTAALAVLGATPNAKRVAGAHAIFNVITGLVAIALLPLLLEFLIHLRQTLQLNTAPTTILATFHTTFNVLGVILMWPVTKAMVSYLKKRFRSTEEDEAHAVYLDKNIIGTPILALHALAKEIERIGIIARRMAQGAMSSETGPSEQLEKDKTVLVALEDKVADFIRLMQRGNLPHELDDALPNALRTAKYYREIAEVSFRIAKMQNIPRPIEHSELAEKFADFRGQVVKFLKAADAFAEGYSSDDCTSQLKELLSDYKHLKASLLRAGTRGELPVGKMVHQLELNSDICRIADQAEKGARYLAGLTSVEIEEKKEEDEQPEENLQTE